MTQKGPLVFIPGNVIQLTNMPAHMVRDTYTRAVADIAKCTPLIIPAVNKDLDLDPILGLADGFFLTGSVSNVAPACYGAKQCFDDKDLDLARDALTLPLIRQVIAHDIPMLAICRGMQELNVATGGNLHQKTQDLPGKIDHRDSPEMPLKTSFERKAHNVIIQKGGVFERIGLPPEFAVNSLHQQSVDQLGKGLFVEAISPDGVIEAVSVPGKRFIVGVQWHPEGDVALNPSSASIIEAFGDAVREYAGA